ncbi:hypothetical protein ACFLYQ_07525 [Chloroflexota bacterium]
MNIIDLNAENNKLFRAFLLVCFLLGILFITGCALQSSGNAVMDYERFLDNLRLSGIVIEETVNVPHPVISAEDESIFSVGGKRIRIAGGGILLVLVYEDEAAAKAETEFISRDGHDLSIPDGKFYHQIDYISPPHWYQSGRIIVLYNGPEGVTDDYETLELLNKILGMQFAGDGPVRAIE